MDTMVVKRIRLGSDFEDLRKKLRIRDGSSKADRFARLVKEAKELARPLALYGVAYVDSMGESSVVLDGILFESRVLRVNLGEVHRVFPYVATCGTELHDWAAAQDDLLLRFYADQISESALREAQEALEQDLEERFQPGSTSAMSPGSLPDWPLHEQRPLFSLLGDTQAAIGVRLTDSQLMVPTKSVSGIRFATEQSFASCQLCPRARCPSRRAAYDGTLFGRKYSQGKESGSEGRQRQG